MRIERMGKGLDDFLRGQLSGWPLAKGNFAALEKCCRRRVAIGEAQLEILHNPARIVSTGAATDAKSVKARPCFLCGTNRPVEQIGLSLSRKFEILVNPFPILTPHFTIASLAHERQSAPPVEMLAFAELYPGMVAFYNGARAGASAPDHLHFQGVRASGIPLLDFASGKEDMLLGGDASYPAGIINLRLGSDMESAISGWSKFAHCMTGYDAASGEMDTDLVNVFVWRDGDGEFRMVIVPRLCHRPACYYAEDESRRLVSPGALDVGGIIVTPRRSDFDALTSGEIEQIFAETTMRRDALDSLMDTLTPELS